MIVSLPKMNYVTVQKDKRLLKKIENVSLTIKDVFPPSVLK